MTGALCLAAAGTATAVEPGEAIVYGVYRPVDLTGDPQQAPPKDYYVSLGTRNGIQHGSTLQVFRKLATHDLVNRKAEADVTVPVATLKVIHAEGTVAVARLEKLFPAAEAPEVEPRAVMVGDNVQLAK
ncbi:MAG TPA: hypothetical protein VL588_07330 [Bdellovibrionota bacterium]|jgi:hypothetical protein|nr:hypothetical protein [Bdellovibrionota bacterium]